MAFAAKTVHAAATKAGGRLTAPGRPALTIAMALVHATTVFAFAMTNILAQTAPRELAPRNALATAHVLSCKGTNRGYAPATRITVVSHATSLPVLVGAEGMANANMTPRDPRRARVNLDTLVHAANLLAKATPTV